MLVKFPVGLRRNGLCTVADGVAPGLKFITSCKLNTTGKIETGDLIRMSIKCD